MPVHAELARAIGERQGDFRIADRLALVGAVENDVGHFAAAQRLGRLLAEHPADGVENVGFSATVGADDRGHALVEIENGFVGKGFEAEELEGLEMHAVGKLGRAYIPRLAGDKKNKRYLQGRAGRSGHKIWWSGPLALRLEDFFGTEK